MNFAEYPIISIPGFADPVSCWTHLLGAVVALVAGVHLISKYRGQGLRRAGLIIFVSGTVFMFSMSGIYHLLDHGGTPRMVLQRLDHAAIWLMIAGCFTPIHLFHFQGWARWGVLAFVWTAAVNGIVLKTVFFNELSDQAGIALYLGFGWIGLLSLILLIRRLGFRATLPMIYGGLAYTIGAGIMFADLPMGIPGVIGPHEIFHVSVLAGTAFIWQFIQQAIRAQATAQAL
jgi:channel protein (hemolysin III family)